MIYFLRAEKNYRYIVAGDIKIGTTIRLSVRLKQITVEIGHVPTVLAVLDGSFAEEHALHIRFVSDHRYGEWFEPCDDLLRLIETEGRPWDGQDEGEDSTVISIKTTVAFRDWLAEIADAERSTIVQILEKAAVEYGEKRGFRKAPRRTGR